MISLDDVERSIPVSTAELDDGFFRVRAGRTSNPERAYLRAMAELGPGPVRSSAVAALLAKKTTALGPTRDGLIKRAICYSPRWGEIDFTVPCSTASCSAGSPTYARSEASRIFS